MSESEFKVVMFGSGDEPGSTMGFAPTREEARELTAEIADHIDAYGSLPVAWDVVWPVPAAVTRRYKNGKLGIRADCYERETDYGVTSGAGTIEIIEVLT